MCSPSLLNVVLCLVLIVEKVSAQSQTGVYIHGACFIAWSGLLNELRRETLNIAIRTSIMSRLQSYLVSEGGENGGI